MTTATLNLGILAHVDAGKTSLTERLLFEHGAIRALGSVDQGNTTTDSGDIERERGITIRSAVASFDIGDLRVNLVDTPGHPDFIAEVERALSVLDGVVLVISAVEGIQAQTKVLMRSLRKIGLPTLIFVNKIDRMGARTDALLADIRRSLAPRILPMNSVIDAGGELAGIVDDVLPGEQFGTAEREEIIVDDERLLARTLDGHAISTGELMDSLSSRTRDGATHPLFFGSALVGIGIEALSLGIARFLPRTPHRKDDVRTPKGNVFAIDRRFAGEKVAYVRLFEGSLHARQTLIYTQREPNGQIKEHTETISGLELVALGSNDQDANLIGPGDIAKVRGLSAVRVGARLGKADSIQLNQHFPPPGLETIVHVASEAKKAKLHAALLAMSDEDPLIQARLTANGGLSIQLYGEVQKEVIRERLNREYRIDPIFSETKPVYFERPVGLGEADFEYDTIHVHDNIFPISIGLRIEPGAIGSGNQFVREAKWGLMPGGFYRQIEDSALRTLSQGLYGWEVTDCIVYLVKVGYERPLAVASHFRNLAAILTMRALDDAKSRVFEPCNQFELDVPDAAHGVMIGYLNQQGADIEQSEQSGPSSWLINGTMPARIVQEVTRDLPGLTFGEGVLTSLPGGDRAVVGKYPIRERLDGNPLDYDNYLKYLAKNKLL